MAFICQILAEQWKYTGNFNTFANHLNIIDESTDKYVHSAVRRHTTDSATIELLKETIEAVFGTSMRQLREVFTPPKNYVFSRIQLKFLHSQVARVLVDKFTGITNYPNGAQHLPKTKGQQKDLENYIMPSLFDEKAVKSYFLPLGFQCHHVLYPDWRTWTLAHIWRVLAFFSWWMSGRAFFLLNMSSPPNRFSDQSGNLSKLSPTAWSGWWYGRLW